MEKEFNNIPDSSNGENIKGSSENKNNINISEENLKNDESIGKSKEGEKKYSESVRPEEEGYASKEENSSQKEENFAGQSEIHQGDRERYGNVNGNYSYGNYQSYNQGGYGNNNYSYGENLNYGANPNYGGNNGNDGNPKKSKNEGKKKGGGKGLIIATCLALSIIFGTLAGVGVNIAINGFDGIIGSKNDGHITVEKNNGGVLVDEVTYDEDKNAMSIMGVVEKAADSVVEVSTLKNSNSGQFVTSGAGSGVLIAKGDKFSYIVTNYHVAGNSDYIKVLLKDGREYEATYIDGDDAKDIAVIKIEETEGITTAKVGSSKKLRVGEGVVAIGNPLGRLGGTVTNGIISALDREINVDGTRMVLLQTNAAVNPGNSGGGLFNMAGELVGIVNAKESKEGIEGLAFAIPIDLVYGDIIDILEDGYIHGRISLGFELTYLDEYWSYRYFRTGVPGLYVISSDIEQLKQGDRITEINSKTVLNGSDYMSAMSGVGIGDKVILRVVNESGPFDIEITVKEYIPDGVKKSA